MLKTLATRYLPAPVEYWIREWRYHFAVQNAKASDDPELLGCKMLVQSGSTAIDVGANIGIYTRFLSEYVGATGRVYSLEPIPETFSYLRSNVARLGLSNVDCYMMAASDQNGSARMAIPQFDNGSRNLYRAELCSGGELAVRVTTLDSLFLDHAPQFIKVDVEGHEFACISGAREIINRYHPCWLVEVKNHNTFQLMDSLGYSPWSFENGTFRKYDPKIGYLNYFFLPRD